MRFCLFALFLFGIMGCAHRPGRTLILRYEDFGPQVAAYQTIGFEWYQWNNVGDCRPWVRDGIQVVVYEGMSRRQVKKLYPVIPATKQDYRHLSLQDALQYIDHYKDDLPALQVTRDRIMAHFSTENQPPAEHK